MATRFKASELQEMIRVLVRKEMKEVVAATINEVLSERYLKKLAETAQPRGVSHLPIQGEDDEDEEVPHALSNTILGVGQENPVFKKVQKDDHVRQFGENKDRNEMLNLFFEGTKPISNDDNAIQDMTDDVEGVPLPVEKPAVKRMTEVWRQLAGVNNKTEIPAVNPKDLEQREETRLRMLRESLDRPANQ